VQFLLSHLFMIVWHSNSITQVCYMLSSDSTCHRFQYTYQQTSKSIINHDGKIFQTYDTDYHTKPTSVGSYIDQSDVQSWQENFVIWITK